MLPSRQRNTSSREQEDLPNESLSSLELTKDPPLRYCSQGVKPKCTQSRWLSTYVDVPSHSIIIEEYFLDFITAEPLRKETFSLFLPQTFTERIIGKPVCIAALNQYIILQYIKGNSPYLHFIYFDTDGNTAQFFEDDSKYFQRGFTSLYAVECLMSPRLDVALFRLPQPVMSDRRWSKLLRADISSLGDSSLRIKNLCESHLRDRQNQTVAFDPKHPSNVAFLLVDTYCSKCKILYYDVQNRKTISERNQVIDSHRSNVAGGDDDSDDSDDSGIENVHYFLHQCNASYCQSGDLLILVCVVYAAMLPEEAMIKICIFDAGSLQMTGPAHLRTICNLPFPVRGLDSSKHWFFPVFSPCDSELAVWFFQKNAPPIAVVSPIRMNMPFTLMTLCRANIRKRCPHNKIPLLPLPKSMASFLKFIYDSKS